MRARQSVRQDVEGPRNKLGSQTDGEPLRPAEDPLRQRVEEGRPCAPFLVKVSDCCAVVAEY